MELWYLKPVRKTVFMFIGAFLLFFALAFADEYEALIMPFLAKGPPSGMSLQLPVDNKQVLEVIKGFHAVLSTAYLTLEPSSLYTFPMDERLRKNYLDELSFLKRDGRVMEMVMGNLMIGEVKRLSPFVMKVKTVESVNVRYMKAADGAEIVSYPEAEYTMNYTLEMAPLGWKVIAVETLKVERREG